MDKSNIQNNQNPTLQEQVAAICYSKLFFQDSCLPKVYSDFGVMQKLQPPIFQYETVFKDTKWIAVNNGLSIAQLSYDALQTTNTKVLHKCVYDQCIGPLRNQMTIDRRYYQYWKIFGGMIKLEDGRVTPFSENPVFFDVDGGPTSKDQTYTISICEWNAFKMYKVRVQDKALFMQEYRDIWKRLLIVKGSQREREFLQGIQYTMFDISNFGLIYKLNAYLTQSDYQDVSEIRRTARITLGFYSCYRAYFDQQFKNQLSEHSYELLRDDGYLQPIYYQQQLTKDAYQQVEPQQVQLIKQISTPTTTQEETKDVDEYPELIDMHDVEADLGDWSQDIKLKPLLKAEQEVKQVLANPYMARFIHEFNDVVDDVRKNLQKMASLPITSPHKFNYYGFLRKILTHKDLLQIKLYRMHDSIKGPAVLLVARSFCVISLSRNLRSSLQDASKKIMSAIASSQPDYDLKTIVLQPRCLDYNNIFIDYTEDIKQKFYSYLVLSKYSKIVARSLSQYRPDNLSPAADDLINARDFRVKKNMIRTTQALFETMNKFADQDIQQVILDFHVKSFEHIVSKDFYDYFEILVKNTTKQINGIIKIWCEHNETDYAEVIKSVQLDAAKRFEARHANDSFDEDESYMAKAKKMKGMDKVFSTKKVLQLAFGKTGKNFKQGRLFGYEKDLYNHKSGRQKAEYWIEKKTGVRIAGLSENEVRPKHKKVNGSPFERLMFKYTTSIPEHAVTEYEELYNNQKHIDRLTIYEETVNIPEKLANIDEAFSKYEMSLSLSELPPLAARSARMIAMYYSVVYLPDNNYREFDKAAQDGDSESFRAHGMAFYMQMAQIGQVPFSKSYALAQCGGLISAVKADYQQFKNAWELSRVKGTIPEQLKELSKIQSIIGVPLSIFAMITGGLYVYFVGISEEITTMRKSHPKALSTLELVPHYALNITRFAFRTAVIPLITIFDEEAMKSIRAVFKTSAITIVNAVQNLLAPISMLIHHPWVTNIRLKAVAWTIKKVGDFQKATKEIYDKEVTLKNAVLLIPYKVLYVTANVLKYPMGLAYKLTKAIASASWSVLCTVSKFVYNQVTNGATHVYEFFTKDYFEEVKEQDDVKFKAMQKEAPQEVQQVNDLKQVVKRKPIMSLETVEIHTATLSEKLAILDRQRDEEERKQEMERQKKAEEDKLKKLNLEEEAKAKKLKSEQEKQQKKKANDLLKQKGIKSSSSEQNQQQSQQSVDQTDSGNSLLGQRNEESKGNIVDDSISKDTKFQGDDKLERYSSSISTTGSEVRRKHKRVGAVGKNDDIYKLFYNKEFHSQDQLGQVFKRSDTSLLSIFLLDAFNLRPNAKEVEAAIAKFQEGPDFYQKLDSYIAVQKQQDLRMDGGVTRSCMDLLFLIMTDVSAYPDKPQYIQRGQDYIRIYWLMSLFSKPKAQQSITFQMTNVKQADSPQDFYNMVNHVRQCKLLDSTWLNASLYVAQVAKFMRTLLTFSPTYAKGYNEFFSVFKKVQLANHTPVYLQAQLTKQVEACLKSEVTTITKKLLDVFDEVYGSDDRATAAQFLVKDTQIQDFVKQYDSMIRPHLKGTYTEQQVLQLMNWFVLKQTHDAAQRKKYISSYLVPKLFTVEKSIYTPVDQQLFIDYDYTVKYLNNIFDQQLYTVTAYQIAESDYLKPQVEYANNQFVRQEKVEDEKQADVKSAKEKQDNQQEGWLKRCIGYQYYGHAISVFDAVKLQYLIDNIPSFRESLPLICKYSLEQYLKRFDIHLKLPILDDYASMYKQLQTPDAIVLLLNCRADVSQKQREDYIDGMYDKVPILYLQTDVRKVKPQVFYIFRSEQVSVTKSLAFDKELCTYVSAQYDAKKDKYSVIDIPTLPANVEYYKSMLPTEEYKGELVDDYKKAEEDIIKTNRQYSKLDFSKALNFLLEIGVPMTVVNHRDQLFWDKVYYAIYHCIGFESLEPLKVERKIQLHAQAYLQGETKSYRPDHPKLSNLKELRDDSAAYIVKHMDELAGLPQNKQRNLLGQIFYKRLQKIMSQHIFYKYGSKISGMLVDFTQFELVDVVEFISDLSAFEERVEEALNVLSDDTVTSDDYSFTKAYDWSQPTNQKDQPQQEQQNQPANKKVDNKNQDKAKKQPQEKKRGLCKFFKEGKCKNGDQCDYKHEVPKAPRKLDPDYDKSEQNKNALKSQLKKEFQVAKQATHVTLVQPFFSLIATEIMNPWLSLFSKDRCVHFDGFQKYIDLPYSCALLSMTFNLELVTLANLKSVISKKLQTGPFLDQLVVLEEFCKYIREERHAFDAAEQQQLQDVAKVRVKLQLEVVQKLLKRHYDQTVDMVNASRDNVYPSLKITQILAAYCGQAIGYAQDTVDLLTQHVWPEGPLYNNLLYLRSIEKVFYNLEVDDEVTEDEIKFLTDIMKVYGHGDEFALANGRKPFYVCGDKGWSANSKVKEFDPTIINIVDVDSYSQDVVNQMPKNLANHAQKPSKQQTVIYVPKSKSNKEEKKHADSDKEIEIPEPIKRPVATFSSKAMKSTWDNDYDYDDYDDQSEDKPMRRPQRNQPERQLEVPEDQPLNPDCDFCKERFYGFFKQGMNQDWMKSQFDQYVGWPTTEEDWYRANLYKRGICFKAQLHHALIEHKVAVVNAKPWMRCAERLGNGNFKSVTVDEPKTGQDSAFFSTTARAPSVLTGYVIFEPLQQTRELILILQPRTVNSKPAGWTVVRQKGQFQKDWTIHRFDSAKQHIQIGPKLFFQYNTKIYVNGDGFYQEQTSECQNLSVMRNFALNHQMSTQFLMTELQKFEVHESLTRSSVNKSAPLVNLDDYQLRIYDMLETVNPVAAENMYNKLTRFKSMVVNHRIGIIRDIRRAPVYKSLLTIYSNVIFAQTGYIQPHDFIMMVITWIIQSLVGQILLSIHRQLYGCLFYQQYMYIQQFTDIKKSDAIVGSLFEEISLITPYILQALLMFITFMVLENNMTTPAPIVALHLTLLSVKLLAIAMQQKIQPKGRVACMIFSLFQSWFFIQLWPIKLPIVVVDFSLDSGLVRSLALIVFILVKRFLMSQINRVSPLISIICEILEILGLFYTGIIVLIPFVLAQLCRHVKIHKLQFYVSPLISGFYYMGLVLIKNVELLAVISIMLPLFQLAEIITLFSTYEINQYVAGISADLFMNAKSLHLPVSRKVAIKYIAMLFQSNKVLQIVSKLQYTAVSFAEYYQMTLTRVNTYLDTLTKKLRNNETSGYFNPRSNILSLTRQVYSQLDCQVSFINKMRIVAKSFQQQFEHALSEYPITYSWEEFHAHTSSDKKAEDIYCLKKLQSGAVFFTRNITNFSKPFESVHNGLEDKTEDAKFRNITVAAQGGLKLATRIVAFYAQKVLKQIRFNLDNHHLYSMLEGYAPGCKVSQLNDYYTQLRVKYKYAVHFDYSSFDSTQSFQVRQPVQELLTSMLKKLLPHLDILQPYEQILIQYLNNNVWNIKQRDPSIKASDYYTDALSHNTGLAVKILGTELSGCAFTTISNSLMNMLVLKTIAAIENIDLQPIVAGDDTIVCSNVPYYDLLDILSKYYNNDHVKTNGNAITPFVWDGLKGEPIHFLSSTFVKVGDQYKLCKYPERVMAYGSITSSQLDVNQLRQQIHGSLGYYLNFWPFTRNNKPVVNYGDEVEFDEALQLSDQLNENQQEQRIWYSVNPYQYFYGPQLKPYYDAEDVYINVNGDSKRNSEFFTFQGRLPKHISLRHINDMENKEQEAQEKQQNQEDKQKDRRQKRRDKRRTVKQMAQIADKLRQTTKDTYKNTLPDNVYKLKDTPEFQDLRFDLKNNYRKGLQLLGQKYMAMYKAKHGLQGMTSLNLLTSLIGDDLVDVVSSGLNKLASMAHPALGYVVEKLTDYVKSGASAKTVRDYINSFIDDKPKNNGGSYRYALDTNQMLSQVIPATYSPGATGLNSSAIVHAIDPSTYPFEAFPYRSLPVTGKAGVQTQVLATNLHGDMVTIIQPFNIFGTTSFQTVFNHDSLNVNTGVQVPVGSAVTNIWADQAPNLISWQMISFSVELRGISNMLETSGVVRVCMFPNGVRSPVVAASSAGGYAITLTQLLQAPYVVTASLQSLVQGNPVKVVYTAQQWDIPGEELDPSPQFLSNDEVSRGCQIFILIQGGPPSKDVGQMNFCTSIQYIPNKLISTIVSLRAPNQGLYSVQFMNELIIRYPSLPIMSQRDRQRLCETILASQPEYNAALQAISRLPFHRAIIDGVNGQLVQQMVSQRPSSESFQIRVLKTRLGQLEKALQLKGIELAPLDDKGQNKEQEQAEQNNSPYQFLQETQTPQTFKLPNGQAQFQQNKAESRSNSKKQS